ncbi:MAG: DNA-binding protein [Oscillospiraceae bacterium]|nr:DNA-binding protein [Oscillospiraceae bacterium]
MCRMRSIRETAEIFREMDPGTQITEKTLRIMIAEGTIPVVKTGVKFLINVDRLLEMFGASPENGMAKINTNAIDPVINK